MNYNRGVLAAGLLVGVICVTILLRVKFYFSPPTTGPVSPITGYFSTAVLDAIEPPEDLVSADTPTLITPTTEVTGQIVQPTVVATSALQTPVRHDLPNGITPQLVVLPDKYLVGFLTDQRYVVQMYSADWQALDEPELLLTDDLGLIQGTIPFTFLTAVNDQLYLLYAKQQTDGVALIAKQYSLSGELQNTYTLISGLATQDNLTATVGAEVMALATTTDSVTTLKIFSTAGELLTERVFDAQGKIVGLIPDQDAVIIVTTLPQTVRFTKLSHLGIVQQTANAAVPEAEEILAVTRLGNLITLRTATALISLADNLSQRYPDILLKAEHLYPSITAYEQQFFLSYNTATSVTDYAIHVMEYSRTPH